jgi:hypothetical protein
MIMEIKNKVKKKLKNKTMTNTLMCIENQTNV